MCFKITHFLPNCSVIIARIALFYRKRQCKLMYIVRLINTYILIPKTLVYDKN